MDNFIIPAAIIVAFLSALILGALLSKRGFWRGFFWFFVIIFLVGWSGQLWIPPFGPVWLGVSWLTLLFMALLFSFLIIAFSPPVISNAKEQTNIPEAPGIILGTFFWFLIILLITSIIIGYYKIPPV